MSHSAEATEVKILTRPNLTGNPAKAPPNTKLGIGPTASKVKGTLNGPEKGEITAARPPLNLPRGNRAADGAHLPELRMTLASSETKLDETPVRSGASFL